MTRAVLFDTETTGLDPATGDRVIEVAALELINDLPTGQFFHALIHPERDIPEEASRIHGFRLTDLEGKPKFAEIAADLVAFFGAADRAQRAVRFRLPESRIRPDWAAKAASGAHGRYAAAGESAVSRDAEQPGRAVPAIRDRPVAADHP
jgi:hypothetical protein